MLSGSAANTVKQTIGIDQFQGVADLFQGCGGGSDGGGNGGAPDSTEAERDRDKRLVFSCDRLVRLIAMLL